MDNPHIIFGKVKRADPPSLKSLLVWPEVQPVIRPTRGNSQQFTTEFQDSYKIIKNPGIATPKIEENDQAKLEENQEVVQENFEKPLETLKTQQNPKTVKKIASRNLSTRLLPNSAHASKFDKPVFACFGQGNKGHKNSRLFSKKCMKTYNILPYSKEHKSSSVFETAKLKYHQNKILSSNNALIDKSLKTENSEIKLENSENFEVKPEEIEAKGTFEEKTVEKVNFSAQIEENSIKEPLCLKCSLPLTPSETQPYQFVSKNISSQNPKNYKHLPFSHTKSIPFAGKPQEKSLSAYKTIFG